MQVRFHAAAHLAGLFFCLLLSPASRAVPFSTSYAYPGAYETYFWGLNDSGDIVGSYSSPRDDGPGTREQGLVIRQGHIESVSLHGFDYLSLTGINNLGHYVGTARTGNEMIGIYFDGQEIRQIRHPEAERTSLAGINDQGQIIGSRSGGGSFIYHNEIYSDIAISDASIVEVSAINNLGQVSGFLIDANNKGHAFLLDPSGTISLIDSINDLVPFVYGINDFEGQFAGGLDSADGTTRFAFASVEGTTFRLAAPYSNARDINNHREVVGWRLTAEGSRAFVTCLDGRNSGSGLCATFAVPEPGALALVLTGLLSLVHFSRVPRSYGRVT